MPDHESRITDLEQQVRVLTESQQAINADVAPMPESLVLNFRVLARNIEGKFAEQNRKIDAKIDAKFAAQDRKIDALAADVGHLRADVAAVLKILGEHYTPKS